MSTLNFKGTNSYWNWNEEGIIYVYEGKVLKISFYN